MTSESRILRYAVDNAHRQFELPLFPEQEQVDALEATGAWHAYPRGEWYISAIPGHYLCVPRLRAVLAAALLVFALAGCQKDNVRIEYVDRDVPVQVPLDPRLVVVPEFPSDPPFRCRDMRGARTVCHEDDADWKERMKKALSVAIEQIKAIAELQPKP